MGAHTLHRFRKCSENRNGRSHRCFYEGYQRHSAHDVKIWSLPPKVWKWRMRGSAYHFAERAERALGEGVRPDVVLASDYLNVADWRAIAPAAFGRVPTAVYFHENQLEYPEATERAVGAGFPFAWINLSSALAADEVFFNSRYHRELFLRRVELALSKMPDAVPSRLSKRLAERSDVFPVGIDFDAGAPPAVDDAEGLESSPTILWNHRWEYDKGPGLLLDIAEAASQSDVVFNVVGQQFRQRPDVFDRLEARLRERGALGAWGFIEDRQAYRELLATCDIALSTADHDFQGLAVMEACLLGCTPLVPDRLAYPEWFPETFRYRDAQEAVAMLASYAANKRAGVCLPRADLSAVTAEALLPRYREVLGSLAGGPAGPWVS